MAVPTFQSTQLEGPECALAPGFRLMQPWLLQVTEDPADATIVCTDCLPQIKQIFKNEVRPALQGCWTRTAPCACNLCGPCRLTAGKGLSRQQSCCAPVRGWNLSLPRAWGCGPAKQSGLDKAIRVQLCKVRDQLTQADMGPTGHPAPPWDSGSKAVTGCSPQNHIQDTPSVKLSRCQAGHALSGTKCTGSPAPASFACTRYMQNSLNSCSRRV